MSSSLNWEKAHRQEWPRRVPDPPTQRQIDYILGLAHEKGKTVSAPVSKRKAGELIDMLQRLPSVNEKRWFRNGRIIQPVREHEAIEEGLRREAIIELRERLSCLSPMTVTALLQVLETVDPLTTAFVLDEVMTEDLPDDPPRLILYVLGRFVGSVSGDEHTVAAG